MGLVILCGVVVFGFYLWIYLEFYCILRYIYGVDMDVRFDLVVYEEFKKEVIDGVEYCIGLFDKFVGKGEKLFDGEYFVIKYYILMIL